MQLPKGAMLAVADGEKLSLFRNSGDEVHPKLTALPDAEIGVDHKGSGGRHHSSAANPDDKRLDEDSFAAGIAALLNRRVLDGKVEDLVVIADPKTLGELRKHYHAKLSAVLRKEIAKDLTGHSTAEIETAVLAA